MRQNPHVRICGGPGSATTLVYPTAKCPTGGSRTARMSSPGCRRGPTGVVVVCAVVTLFATVLGFWWSTTGRNRLTGDEPHSNGRRSARSAYIGST